MREGVARFFVTGFGPFLPDAPTNPTQALVERLADAERTSSSYSIEACEIVEVDIERAKCAVKELEARVREPTRTETKSSSVLIHLGVHSTLRGYRVERVAWNESSFRIPDAAGRKPQGVTICAEDGGLEACLRTVIPVEEVVDRLQNLGYPCEASNDAGRYLCNFIYYGSLKASAQVTSDGVSDCTSLFVHVPPFSVIEESSQCAFVQDLLRVVAELYA